MKRTIVLLLVLSAGMGIFYLASADGHRTYQWPYSRVDRGMMGFGPEMGWTMGPGMMGMGHGPGMMGMGYGPGMMGFGPEMGSTMGPGMMGMGYGRWMMPNLWRLPIEKREQLREFQIEMSRVMATIMAEMRSHSIALQETLRQFPLDREAARQQWQAANQTRLEMFNRHLEMMARMQNILGKEMWDAMIYGRSW